MTEPKSNQANDKVNIPADVPPEMASVYVNNFMAATHQTGKLMMFAADQKIEHLNDDFYGKTVLGDVAFDDSEPEHLFRIAQQASIGVFGSQLGLISSYGRDYSDIHYVAKLNSKTHLVKTQQKDPLSLALWSVEDVINMQRHSGINFVGVGYTIYLGSEYENQMLVEAAQIIKQAHYNGLLAVIWIYPRGKAVENEQDVHLIAGATGVAACLGADFVKVNYPETTEFPAKAFNEAVQAAGRTGVVCAGGSSTTARDFLQKIHDQIHISGARGNATGRNIHQKSLEEAVSMCNAISAITLKGHDVDFAEQVFLGNTHFSL